MGRGEGGGRGQILLFFPFMVYLVCQTVQLKYLPPCLLLQNSCLKPKCIKIQKHTHLATAHGGYRWADAKNMHVCGVCVHQRVEDRYFNAAEYYGLSELFTCEWSPRWRVLVVVWSVRSHSGNIVTIISAVSSALTF